MIKTGSGYIFEVTRDSKNQLGVKERFDVGFRGNNQIVDLLVCVNSVGKPMDLVCLNASTGFTSVVSIYGNDLEKFYNSHKPLFGIIGQFSLICGGRLVFDKTSGALIEDKTLIGFYMPKTTISLDKLHLGSAEDVGLVCEKLSTVAELNSVVISDYFMTSWRSCLLKYITQAATMDRKTFLYRRLAMANE